MKDHGKPSSEPAPVAEVTEVLRKLKRWRLAENGNVLEGRYRVKDEGAAMRLISQATYLAYWQDWPLTKIGYQDHRIFFRLGDPEQAGVSRNHLLQATAIHGCSLPGTTPTDARGDEGDEGVDRVEDYRALFKKFCDLSSAEFDRALASLGHDSPLATTGNDLFDNNPIIANHRQNETMNAIIAEHPLALQLAERALLAACRLVPNQAPAVLVVDYVSDAWSQLALAAALAEDLPRARLAVRLAERIQTEGSGDPETAALTSMARASALGPTDPKAALESIAQAQSLLSEIGGSSLLGWIFIRQGLLLLELNLQRAAAKALRQGLRLTDPSAQRAMFQRAQQALEQLEPEASSTSSTPRPTNGEDLPN